MSFQFNLLIEKAFLPQENLSNMKRSVMRKLLFPLFLISLYCCSTNNQHISKQVIKKLEKQQDSLSLLFPSVVKPLIESDWLDQYSYYIKKKFPEFTIDYSKQDYLVVPELNIPANVIEKNNTDIAAYLKKGNLEIKYSTIYILENNRPVGTFKILRNSQNPFTPGTFHSSFKESKIINIIRSSDLYFEIEIKDDPIAFFIPAVVFYSQGRFQVFDTMEDKIYPINEIYRAYSPDKEKFKKDFINKIVEVNNK